MIGQGSGRHTAFVVGAVGHENGQTVDNFSPQRACGIAHELPRLVG